MGFQETQITVLLHPHKIPNSDNLLSVHGSANVQGDNFYISVIYQYNQSQNQSQGQKRWSPTFHIKFRNTDTPSPHI